MIRQPATHWSIELPENTCPEALRWAQNQNTGEDAWRACERGDWMLWLLGKWSGEPGSDARRKLVLAACECARLALPYVRKGEGRPLKAIETAEAWGRGEIGVTLYEVRNAAAAAYTAAAAAAAAAYAAAAAAAYTAYAAAAAAAAYTATAAAAYTAAAYTAYAAAAAAYTAAAYTATAARSKVLSQCADIVRKHYPEPPKKP